MVYIVTYPTDKFIFIILFLITGNYHNDGGDIYAISFKTMQFSVKHCHFYKFLDLDEMVSDEMNEKKRIFDSKINKINLKQWSEKKKGKHEKYLRIIL